MNPLIPIILQLVAQYGPVVARGIVNAVNSGMGADGRPTDAMWEKLIVLENESHAKFATALSKPPGT